MTVPMEGLTNQQARAVIAEDEGRARAVLAEQRAVYGDPDQEAAAVYGGSRPKSTAAAGRVGMTVGHAHLTAAELDTLRETLQQVLDRGRDWAWRDSRNRERVRSVLGKLKGTDGR